MKALDAGVLCLAALLTSVASNAKAQTCAEAVRSRPRDYGPKPSIIGGEASVGDPVLSRRIFSLLERRTSHLAVRSEGFPLSSDTAVAGALRQFVDSSQANALAVARNLSMMMQGSSFQATWDEALLASTTYMKLSLPIEPAAALATGNRTGDETRWLALRALVPFEDTSSRYLDVAAAVVCILSAKEHAVSDLFDAQDSVQASLSEPDWNTFLRILYVCAQRQSRNQRILNFQTLLSRDGPMMGEIRQRWRFLMRE